MNGYTVVIFQVAGLLLTTKAYAALDVADYDRKKDAAAALPASGFESGHRRQIREYSKRNYAQNQPDNIQLAWEIANIADPEDKELESGDYFSHPSLMEEFPNVRDAEDEEFSNDDVVRWPKRLRLKHFPAQYFISNVDSSELRDMPRDQVQVHHDANLEIKRRKPLDEDKRRGTPGESRLLIAQVQGSSMLGPVHVENPFGPYDDDDDVTENQALVSEDDGQNFALSESKNVRQRKDPTRLLIINDAERAESARFPKDRPGNRAKSLTFRYRATVGDDRQSESPKKKSDKEIPSVSNRVHIKGPIINSFADRPPHVHITHNYNGPDPREETEKRRLLLALLREVVKQEKNKVRDGKEGVASKKRPATSLFPAGKMLAFDPFEIIYRGPQYSGEQRVSSHHNKPPKKAKQEKSNTEKESSTDTSIRDTGKVTIQSDPPCFKYEGRSKTCWINRQIGSSLNIEPRVYDSKGKEMDTENLEIEWFRRYRTLNRSKIPSKEITDVLTQPNLFIGDDSKVLRVSPLQEIDMDYNSFKVVIREDPSTCPNGTIPKIIAEMVYRIQIIPVEMGILYPGEDLTIDIRSYMTLPSIDLQLQWFVERGLRKRSSLPPNMVVTENGFSLSITELPAGKSWLVVCAVYDKASGIFLAKRRFSFMQPKRL